MIQSKKINHILERNVFPGLSILLQNVFIFASSMIFKFGRSEDLWGN